MSRRCKLKATDSPRTWTLCAICALLAIAVAIVFAPALGHGFVNYDDDEYVYGNLHITGGLTPANIAWWFTHTQGSNWHPLTSISLLLDHSIHGLNAGGFHLTNILLHAATVILLFLVLVRMTGAVGASALVAALFAIHPLRAESVAWVTERKDVLSGFFFVLTVAAYARYARKGPSFGRYAAVALLFAMGLMSKTMLVTVPCVLLLLDYWPLRRMTSWRTAALLAAEKIPLLALSVACAVAAVFNQKAGGTMDMVSNVPLPWRAANAVVAYVEYLRQTFLPVGLAAFYPHPGKSLSLWLAGACLLLLAGVSAAVILMGKKRPWLPVGWLWYLGMLVPAIGIVQAGAQAHADRFTYLPQIGIFIALVWTAAEISKNIPRWQTWCASGAIVLCLMVPARRQVGYWRDTRTLWEHALACTANNYIAHNGLGIYFDLRGQPEEGISHFRAAIRSKSDFADPYGSLGLLLATNGKTDEAAAAYQKAIEIDPSFAQAHYNYGNLLVGRGEMERAVGEYRLALKFVPHLTVANSNLGLVLAGQGRTQEAIDCYLKALQFEPDNAVIHNNLASALSSQGRKAEAIEHYRRAFQIKPDYVEAVINLADALAEAGNAAEAVKYCGLAEPLAAGRDPAILGALATAYAKAARMQDAARISEQAAEACEQRGDAARAAAFRRQAEGLRQSAP